MVFEDRAGTMINYTPAYLPEPTWTSGFVSKLQNWINACTKGPPMTAPGTEGMAGQKMLDGIYRSAEVGHEVTID